MQLLPVFVCLFEIILYLCKKKQSSLKRMKRGVFIELGVQFGDIEGNRIP